MNPGGEAADTPVDTAPSDTEERRMRRLMLAALVAAAGCTELIAPDDPRYDDMCVIYVAEDQGAEISKEMFDRCETLEIMVVRFSS